MSQFFLNFLGAGQAWGGAWNGSSRFRQAGHVSGKEFCRHKHSVGTARQPGEAIGKPWFARLLRFCRGWREKHRFRHYSRLPGARDSELVAVARNKQAYRGHDDHGAEAKVRDDVSFDDFLSVGLDKYARTMSGSTVEGQPALCAINTMILRTLADNRPRPPPCGSRAFEDAALVFSV